MANQHALQENSLAKGQVGIGSRRKCYGADKDPGCDPSLRQSAVHVTMLAGAELDRPGLRQNKDDWPNKENPWLDEGIHLPRREESRFPHLKADVPNVVQAFSPLEIVDTARQCWPVLQNLPYCPYEASYRFLPTGE